MIKCLDLLCVQDVEWLKSITTLPILLKGIVTAEDGNKLNLLP
jgi:isopentenyl diphosphate isomerase/L-lactate dehydrogenase-like FMN-dependent dehydrogenase